MDEPDRAHLRSGSVTAVPVARTPLGYRIAKRSLDILGAGIGLAIASPIMIGAAAAIRLESRGPVFFRQQRVGLGGRTFTVLKFRTMLASASEGVHEAYVRELIRAQHSTQPDSTWTPIAMDPRVTRIGGFLRRSHIDELPQLINIMRGEMSLVGPRPPIPYEVELYEPWHLGRLAVVPGLTGLWQANGWGKLSFDEGVALDLEYVRRRSLRLDVAIIGRTMWQIATGRQF